MVARIVCGPVVGLVQYADANVLLELSESGSTKMLLQDAQQSNNTAEITLQTPARRPCVFRFRSLIPGTTYNILVPEVTGDRVLGQVKTLPVEIYSVGVAVVSCDRPQKGMKDMWAVLGQNLKDKSVHAVLHIGDNVYVDGMAFADNKNVAIVDKEDPTFNPKKIDQSTPYIAARKLIHGLDKSEWASKREEILEIYRNKYREVWTRPSKAKVLANFSNLMILDDHEIRDDFGTMKQDSDPDHEEYFLGHVALQVYHEYQRQLWDPDVMNTRNRLKNECYEIQIGPLGILMTDARTPRSLYMPKRQSGDESYFGKEQMDSIQRHLGKGESVGVRMHVVVAPLPLLFLKKRIFEIADKMKFSDEMKAFIDFHHDRDIVPIFDAISKRKGEMGATGDVIMFAGDLHIGGFTDIFQRSGGREELICRQITSSAICNKHWKLHSYNAIRGLMHFTDTYGNYGYRHYDWTNKCNFATLKVDFSNPTQISYVLDLVDEKGTETRRSSDLNWDKGYQSKCCDVL